MFNLSLYKSVTFIEPYFLILHRGLLPTNKVGIPKLVDDKAYMHQLFSIGNAGAATLLVRAYQTFSWADTDFRAKNKV